MHTRALVTNIRLLGGRAVIDLKGEIDGLAEQELSEAYQQAIESEPEVIVLNFKEVDYINSTGIALIVGLLAQARKTHRTLSVYGLSDHYMEIFAITRLSDFMEIYPDEEAALAA